MMECLEPRQHLAFGPFPQLIDQDLAISKYPDITGQGYTVAIIDTGIDFNHPSLAGKLWVNPGEVAGDGRDNDNDGFIDNMNGWDYYRNDARPEDENNHGTAMAGIITAKPFTFGGAEYQGLAQGVKIISLKVADPTGRVSDTAFAQRIEKALQWVEQNHQRHKIAAVNMSLRVPTSDYDSTIRDELDRLSAAGVFLTATAGHGGPEADPRYPVRHPGVYGAGIIHADDTIAERQTRSEHLDLLTPASEVPALFRGGSYFSSGTATSYAAPHLTAAAVLIEQINPRFTPAQIMAILKDSGQSIPDPLTGNTYKRLDLDNALALAYERSGQAPRPPFNVGKRIQAEHFHRANPTVLRPQSSKGAQGQAVRLRDNQSLDFDLNITGSSRHSISLRLSSPSAKGKFTLLIEGRKSATLNLPRSGAKFQTVNVPSLSLSTGRHMFRILYDGPTSKSNATLDWIQFARA